ncbi:hypothetical protein NE237_020479 [Protea cynaroides]|uniref:Uncharacterized protein n=1 Tax=Protea cynaroides TaxID=273540 RepID=A0A9Q0H7B9_9MAGN|nr:hypothetical protein NE237_020479 [Protea cynaroides]
MGKLLCDTTTAIAETFQASPPLLPWRDPISAASLDISKASDLIEANTWDTVSGLEEQQKRYLQRLHAKGVLWKQPEAHFSPEISFIFRLSHGGDVEADGNCLFTASQKAMGSAVDARELRRRTVRRFLEDLASYGTLQKDSIDAAIKHLYAPDLKAGWGIHVVQELKLLAKKEDRVGLDVAIMELVDLGMQREMAAESIYKERCIAVDDALSWAKYMSISGTPDDEFDIITLQYTEEGLLTVDENREGRAAAFGDDIAIESLATEFKREIYVVQAHGSDGMVDEENCVFFLPHRPRGQICEPPFFLFMKGTGWCGAGADHYEPLIALPAPCISQEKAAVVL